MRNAARFSHSRSTFVCQDCGYLTREAGENDGLDLCPICAELAGLQNTLSDNGEESFREWGLVRSVENCRTRADHLRNDSERVRIHESYSELFELIDDSHPPEDPLPAPVAKATEKSTNVEALVDLVLENARRRYAQGGDLLVECHTRAEIAEAIGQSTTAKGAIFWTWRRLGIHVRHSVRRDVQGA